MNRKEDKPGANAPLLALAIVLAPLLLSVVVFTPMLVPLLVLAPVLAFVQLLALALAPTFPCHRSSSVKVHVSQAPEDMGGGGGPSVLGDLLDCDSSDSKLSRKIKKQKE